MGWSATCYHRRPKIVHLIPLSILTRNSMWCRANHADCHTTMLDGDAMQTWSDMKRLKGCCNRFTTLKISHLFYKLLFQRQALMIILSFYLYSIPLGSRDSSHFYQPKRVSDIWTCISNCNTDKEHACISYNEEEG